MTTPTSTTTSQTPLHLPDLDALAAQRLPLYHRYPRMLDPQPAYLALDTRTGAAWPWTDLMIGGSMSPDVWDGLVRRYEIPATITGPGLAALLRTLAPLLERVWAGAAIAWDGQRTVARLDDDAIDAEGDIRLLTARDLPCAQGWDARAWLRGPSSPTVVCAEVGVTPETTDAALAEIAERLAREAEADGVILDGDLAEVLGRWRQARRDEDEDCIEGRLRA